MKKITIYALSDSLGETAEHVSRAVLKQFVEADYDIDIWPNVCTAEKIKEAVEKAQKEDAIIVFTLVVEELKLYLVEEAKKHNVTAVDIITPLLKPLMEHIGVMPKQEPGLLHRFDKQYFQKMDAIDFAVKYDDGKGISGIGKADIVLTGISRTSKTPLSMYLAKKNKRFANIPLVPEISPPKELLSINTKKIIGLYADPYYLINIRKERLKALGLKKTASYGQLERIIEELEYAEKFIRKIGCRKIDITNKAIEEIAGVIVNWYNEDIK